MLTENWFLERILFWIPLLLSLTVHEWAHAWSAYRLGDPTAEREGRLTLNPLAHMDPIGTLLVPLLAPFGWAKPVPINIGLFHSKVGMRTGVMLVAAAGPVSNICIALLSIAILVGWAFLCGSVELIPVSVYSLLNTAIWLNVLLAVFNMIPIPPLDGSRIVDALMPDRLRGIWDAFRGLGPIALAAVVVGLALGGSQWLWWPIQTVQLAVEELLQLVTR